MRLKAPPTGVFSYFANFILSDANSILNDFCARSSAATDRRKTIPLAKPVGRVAYARSLATKCPSRVAYARTCVAYARIRVAYAQALDALRDLVWGQYGCQIQQAIRKDRTQSKRLGKGSYKNMDRGTEPF